ncbi:MAG: hypothetical protein JJU12_05075 [Chlamydiales bacterium]|nr:hypothetical protein [Chlamydiales bacterium]
MFSICKIFNLFDYIINKEHKHVNVKRQIKKYARAIVFQKGIELDTWKVNYAIIPDEFKQAFLNGLKKLPLRPDLKIEDYITVSELQNRAND